MSYARWSNSNWYAFDNVDGFFSLWHVEGGPTGCVDFSYETLESILKTGNLQAYYNNQLTPEDLKEGLYLCSLAYENWKNSQ